MITFQIEKFADIIPEIKTLIDGHRDEVSVFSNAVAPLDPDWEAYIKLENNEALFTYTARDDKLGDMLVGYYIAFISTHIHYRHTLVSDMDIIYLHPAKRDGMMGYKLLKKAEQELESMGVEIIIMSVKANTGVDKLAIRLGHKPMDIKYFREV